MWAEILRRLIRMLSGEEVENGSTPPTPINWYVMPAQQVSHFMRESKLLHLGYRDNFYWGTDIDTWRDWAFEALQGCPEYQTESATQRGFNCDDYADEFPAYCKRTYQANAIWAVWGRTPGGYHAWNLVAAADDWYEFEPQTGEVWVFGTNPDYQADKRL